MQVFDALLSDLSYDWLNIRPNHDINQSCVVLEGQYSAQGVDIQIMLLLKEISNQKPILPGVHSSRFTRFQ